jgi:hypothetical protein
MDEDVAREIHLARGARPDQTMSGLLVTVAQKAREIGFLDALADGLGLRMKVYRYSHAQKLATLVASLAVGCRHTSEIQARLVPDEAAARLFGMARFPDQAQVNAFLRACGAAQVAHLAAAHARLLAAHSRAGDRRLWEGVGARRLLPVDLDQTPLATQSARATGAARGYMGRKRSQYGYQKSVALLGGAVREVLALRLDPGDTHAQEVVPSLLADLDALLRARGVAPGEALIRGDAQYGSAGSVRRYQAAGHHYVVKGYTPRSARAFADALAPTAVWQALGPDSYGNQVWVADAGEQELGERDAPPEGAPVRSRVVLLVRVGWRVRTKHGKGAPGRVREKVVSYEHYLTDLGPEELTARQVVATYNGRETEEGYFRAEQDAFGAHHLRTFRHEGEAAFLWVLASTANLLRWTQATTFRGTPLQHLGLTRLVTQVMRLPATLMETAQGWLVILPELGRLVAQLVHAWLTRATQLPLPFAQAHSFG